MIAASQRLDNPQAFADPAHALRAIMADSLGSAIESAANSVSAIDRRVLRALLASPGHSASLSQLQRIAELRSPEQAGAALARFGETILRALGLRIYPQTAGTLQWWMIVATSSNHDSPGCLLTMRREVVAGLIAAGYARSAQTRDDQLTLEELWLRLREQLHAKKAARS